MKRSLSMIAALGAASLLAGAAVADTVGVSRCDRQENGTFRPGLLTVDSDGNRVFHPIGENGLTESIVFNRSRAFDWVEAQGFFPEDTIFQNYTNYICGLPCEECEEETPAAEQDDDEPENENHEEEERVEQ